MRIINKKGFTLIEVVATVAIASLVMVALVSFFSVVSKVFVSSAVESEERLITSSAKAYLKNELTYATQIGISGDSSFSKIEFKDGRIYKDGVQIFDNEFYGNTSIYGDVTGLGSVLTFNIRVENGETDRTEEYVVKTLNKVDTVISAPVTAIYFK